MKPLIFPGPVKRRPRPFSGEVAESRRVTTPHGWSRGLLGSRRATCRVSTGTPAPRAQILHLRGAGTTWEHSAMSTSARIRIVHRADRVARASGPAVGAAVDPAVRAPLPAYGTRLRGIGFAAGDRPSRRVVELLDDLRVQAVLTCWACPRRTLGGVIEWLAPIARRARERHRHGVRGLLADIAPLALRLVKYPICAALQARRGRACLTCGMGLLEAASVLVRHWIMALAARPLTRRTVTPSVAAISVFTPRSTPITVCCGRGASATSQTRRRTPNDRRASMRRPGNGTVCGTRTRSVPLWPWGRTRRPSRMRAS